MVRPRFAKLAAARQEEILAAALEEFSAFGFHNASLNRVIDAAGISKGSMYYYFDGKEDLYAHVVRVELERMFARLGPLDLSAADDPDAFWSALGTYYLRMLSSLESFPQLARLIREWTGAPATTPVPQIQSEMESAVLPWLKQALEVGQRLGAVRTDLPTDLLLAVAVGMGRAMDTWLLAQAAGTAQVRHQADLLLGMIRRAVQP